MEGSDGVPERERAGKAQWRVANSKDEDGFGVMDTCLGEFFISVLTDHIVLPPSQSEATEASFEEDASTSSNVGARLGNGLALMEYSGIGYELCATADEALAKIDKKITLAKRYLSDNYLLEDGSPVTKGLFPETARLMLAKAIINSKLMGIEIAVSRSSKEKIKVLDPTPQDLEATYTLAKTVQIQQLILLGKVKTAVEMFPDMSDKIMSTYDKHVEFGCYLDNHPEKPPSGALGAITQNHRGRPSASTGAVNGGRPPANATAIGIFSTPREVPAVTEWVRTVPIYCLLLYM
jgi:hypothetical protein